MTMKIPIAALEDGLALRSTAVCKEVDLKLAVCRECRPACVRYRLDKPKRIATGRASMTPIISQPVDDDFLNGESLALGQDVTYGYGRGAPGGLTAWEDEAWLRKRTRELLESFATEDADGKARRLLEAFLTAKTDVEVWSDATLDRAVDSHAHFRAFAEATMNAPGRGKAVEAKTRVHQALQHVGWNIRRMRPIQDLGLLAFNTGPLPNLRDFGLPDPNKVLHLGDFASGLGLMINGEQYALVVAESYDYSSCEARYEIELKFVFYDVFGLDDEDLRRFGPPPSWERAALPDELRIAAWWRLQHEFGYAPLITRAVVRKKYDVSTSVC